MSQPQYVIRANSRCSTHPPGTEIVYTGPRSGLARGWSLVRRIHQPIPGGMT